VKTVLRGVFEHGDWSGKKLEAEDESQYQSEQQGRAIPSSRILHVSGRIETFCEERFRTRSRVYVYVSRAQIREDSARARSFVTLAFNRSSHPAVPIGAAITHRKMGRTFPFVQKEARSGRFRANTLLTIKEFSFARKFWCIPVERSPEAEIK